MLTNQPQTTVIQIPADMLGTSAAPPIPPKKFKDSKCPKRKEEIVPPPSPSSAQHSRTPTHLNYPKVKLISDEDLAAQATCESQLQPPVPPRRLQSISEAVYANLPVAAVAAGAAPAVPARGPSSSSSATDTSNFYVNCGDTGGFVEKQIPQRSPTTVIGPSPDKVIVHEHHVFFHHDASPRLISSTQQQQEFRNLILGNLRLRPVVPTSISEVAHETPLDVKGRNLRELQACGWYHGPLGIESANNLLKDQPAGTFLIRDSSSAASKADCVFSLTFRHDSKSFPDLTCNSVRIKFCEQSCKFQLDRSQETRQEQLPAFDSVVELVEFYLTSELKKTLPLGHTLMDDSNNKSYPICLRKPLMKESGPMSLEHLARLTINARMGTWSKRPAGGAGSRNKAFVYRNHNLQSLDALPLPPKLKECLAEYPHTL